MSSVIAKTVLLGAGVAGWILVFSYGTKSYELTSAPAVVPGEPAPMRRPAPADFAAPRWVQRQLGVRSSPRRQLAPSSNPLFAALPASALASEGNLSTPSESVLPEVATYPVASSTPATQKPAEVRPPAAASSVPQPRATRPEPSDDNPWRESPPRRPGAVEPPSRPGSSDPVAQTEPRLPATPPNPRPQPAPTARPAEPAPVIYEVLHAISGYSSDRVYAEVLVPTLSRRTPIREQVEIVKAIAEREGFGSMTVYCTREAHQAHYSMEYAERNPEALKEGLLGDYERGRFKPFRP